MTVSLAEEDAISQVIEIASLDPVADRVMITNAMRINDYKVDFVLSAWFEGSDSFREKYTTTWNDDFFTAERDGTSNNSGIAFHVESPHQNDIVQGVTPPPEGINYAPSRPPSRANSKSPLSKTVDWTTGNASAIPRSNNQEDEDMKQALRESAALAGIEYQDQESGVMAAPASATTFGPANRTEYNPGEWALVSVASSKIDHAANSVPAPSLRKRAHGAPAFLVPGACNDSTASRIGPLLTILHEIPLARNILLDSGAASTSYGHHKDWWTGQDLRASHAQAPSDTTDAEQSDDSKYALEHEIHRLMAFLDSTERSYGTASVIAETTLKDPLYGEASAECPEASFCEVFTQRNPKEDHPFRTCIRRCRIRGDTVDGETSGWFSALEPDIPAKDSFKYVKTFYEYFDQSMWVMDDARDAGYDSNIGCFEKLAEVLVIKVDSIVPLEISETLYPERWLNSRLDDAIILKREWRRARSKRESLEKARDQMNQFRDSETSAWRPKDEFLRVALKQWVGYRNYLEGAARFLVMEKSGFDTEKYPDYHAAPCHIDGNHENMYEEVIRMVENIEAQLLALERQKQKYDTQIEKIESIQRYLGQVLTDPGKMDRPKPMTCKKYLLRGISTSPFITYVCQRAPGDLIALEGYEPRDQWWRLEFDPNAMNQPAKAEQLDFAQVQTRICEESNSPILVFATVDAIETTPKPLKDALGQFVLAENKAFRRELAQETPRAIQDSGPEPPSPSKRKRRSSIDSMDSNRASTGSADRPFFGKGNRFEDFYDDYADTTRVDGMNIDGVDGGAPPLPDRLPPSTTSTSSTVLTPETEEMDAMDAMDIDRHTQEDAAPPHSPHSDQAQARSPEMKEKAGASSFYSVSGNHSDRVACSKEMNMEISDD